MFPHTIKNVSPDIHEKLSSHFIGGKDGFVEVGKEKWMLPAKYAEQAAGYYNFPPRSDDVWIMTFPRSGTTWCQELIWLMKNDLDFKKSSESLLSERSPFFELSFLYNDDLKKHYLDLNQDPTIVKYLNYIWTPGYEYCADLPSPRVIKTHMPFTLLSPSLLETSKVIYVARNPKDVFISYYHHNKLVNILYHGYRGDMQSYWKFFKEELVCFSPYWEHLRQAWARRNHPNMLFLFYENLSRDLRLEIKRIAKFLDLQYSEEQFQQLVDHLKIENFRQNVPVWPDLKGIFAENEGDFIREGKVGGGDPEMTPELLEEIEKWTEANLQGTDLRFPVKR
ncbi:unnamed protein product [Bemisia tabaci]|uniref:Sulfotransferase domain-containing protein n=1 Tax=Bemisia tabaci TaxID=7038 RepID=A0A9P0EZ65_BEMTA|nr:unnamed protein product [Bemisia tabaci]